MAPDAQGLGRRVIQSIDHPCLCGLWVKVFWQELEWHRSVGQLRVECRQLKPVVVLRRDISFAVAFYEDVLNKGSPFTERRACNNGRSVSTETCHSNVIGSWSTNSMRCVVWAQRRIRIRIRRERERERERGGGGGGVCVCVCVCVRERERERERERACRPADTKECLFPCCNARPVWYWFKCFPSAFSWDWQCCVRLIARKQMRDRQNDRQSSRQTDRMTGRMAGKQTEWQTEKTDRQRDRQRKTDRQTDRQTETETDRGRKRTSFLLHRAFESWACVDGYVSALQVPGEKDLALDPDLMLNHFTMATFLKVFFLRDLVTLLYSTVALCSTVKEGIFVGNLIS